MLNGTMTKKFNEFIAQIDFPTLTEDVSCITSLYRRAYTAGINDYIDSQKPKPLDELLKESEACDDC